MTEIRVKVNPSVQPVMKASEIPVGAFFVASLEGGPERLLLRTHSMVLEVGKPANTWSFNCREGWRDFDIYNYRPLKKVEIREVE